MQDQDFEVEEAPTKKLEEVLGYVLSPSPCEAENCTNFLSCAKDLKACRLFQCYVTSSRPSAYNQEYERLIKKFGKEKIRIPTKEAYVQLFDERPNDKRCINS